MEIKFWAGCLAAYNSGKLHGEWITASDDAEDMAEAVAKMLRASPVADAEEWLVMDWDDPSKALSSMGETSDLDAIAERVEAVEEIANDYDESLVPMLIDWASDVVTEPGNWASTLSDAWAGVHNDAEDYAAEICEDIAGEVPKMLENYIDWRALARDMALNGEVDFIDTATGSHLQSYDDMRGRECIVLRNL